MILKSATTINELVEKEILDLLIKHRAWFNSCVCQYSKFSYATSLLFSTMNYQILLHTKIKKLCKFELLVEFNKININLNY